MFYRADRLLPSAPASCRLSGLCLLPSAPASYLFRCSRCGKQNFLMQVGGRIARYTDMFYFLNVNAGSLQTIAHRLRGKTRTVFHAIESLLLNGCYDSSVFD